MRRVMPVLLGLLTVLIMAGSATAQEIEWTKRVRGFRVRCRPGDRDGRYGRLRVRSSEWGPLPGQTFAGTRGREK
jgi:hypothetical protein